MKYVCFIAKPNFLNYTACRTALLAVHAAQALLLAFALKLKVSRALAGQDGKGGPRLPVAGGLRPGGGFFAERAGGFLGACFDPRYLKHLQSTAALKVIKRTMARFILRRLARRLAGLPVFLLLCVGQDSRIIFRSLQANPAVKRLCAFVKRSSGWGWR